jgi:hypothetical protein
MIVELSFITSEFDDAPTSLLLLAGFLREDYPWLAEILTESYREIRAGGIEDIEKVFQRLRHIMESLSHPPMTRALSYGSKDAMMMVEELSMILDITLHSMMDRKLEKRHRRASSDTEASLSDEDDC